MSERPALPQSVILVLGLAVLLNYVDRANLVTGLIVDRTGRFSGAFAVSAAASLVAAVAWGLVIRRVETVQWPEESVTVAHAVA